MAGGDRVGDAILRDQRDAHADLVAGEDLLPLDRLADFTDIDAVDLPALPGPVSIATRRQQLDESAVVIEEATLIFANDDRAA